MRLRGLFWSRTRVPLAVAHHQLRRLRRPRPPVAAVKAAVRPCLRLLAVEARAQADADQKEAWAVREISRAGLAESGADLKADNAVPMACRQDQKANGAGLKVKSFNRAIGWRRVLRPVQKVKPDRVFRCPEGRRKNVCRRAVKGRKAVSAVPA